MAQPAKRPDTPRRPTMADVGRLAGVTATTVSFVLNETSGQSISPATQQRVMDAVAQLNYRPNKQARGLRLRRMSAIGFVTDEIASDPFAGATILGAHEVSWSHGSLLMVVNTTRNARVFREVIEDLVDRPVDAIILAVVGTRRLTVPDALKGIPTLLVNGWVAGGTLPSVLPDEVAGGRAAAELVLEAGHRRIAFLTGPQNGWATRARLRGFREALTAAGLNPSDALVLEGDFRAGSGHDLARTVIGLPASKRPTAILCGNDRMAVGAYLALGAAGVRIPEDVSVVGYDDQTDLAADLTPSLSTVRMPYYQMGRWAAANVLDGGTQLLPARTYLRCPPVARMSVAPPARLQRKHRRAGSGE